MRGEGSLKRVQTQIAEEIAAAEQIYERRIFSMDAAAEILPKESKHPYGFHLSSAQLL
jgi:hypothetical protein